jgi:hypothetical protein
MMEGMVFRTRPATMLPTVRMAPLAAVVAAALIVVLVGAAILSLAAGSNDSRLAPSRLRPLAAPPPATAADFPEQSHIAACWTLANRSSALDAPRSERSSEVVGPIHADACEDAA